jgi:hypothetical protein
MGSGHERLDGYTIREDAGECAVSRKDTDTDADTEGTMDMRRGRKPPVNACIHPTSRPGGATQGPIAPAGAHEHGLDGMPGPGVVTPGKSPTQAA